MMKRILLIHPEGNINNNPNLSGLAEILCDAGFDLHIVSPRIPNLCQRPPAPGVTMHLFDGLSQSHITGRVFADSTGSAPTPSPFVERFGPFDLVVGIDRGVIEASRVARAYTIPHALISYEIFFRDEAGVDFKRPEIDACRDLAFAVCQDTVRARNLSQENGVSPGRMILIPVSGRGVRPGPKTNYLHERFGIPSEYRIALFAGSVTEMCGISAILQQAAGWSDGWALVIHNRYGLTPGARPYYDACLRMRNVYFSAEPSDTIDGMSRILHSADIGLAFYRTVAGSIYTGKNVGEIGMSSGKIATYLQHGLPVVTNSIGLMSRLIEHHRLGWVMDLAHIDLSTIHPQDLGTYRANCLGFFQERLDLDLAAGAFITEVKRTLGCGDVLTRKGRGEAVTVGSDVHSMREHVATTAGEAVTPSAPSRCEEPRKGFLLTRDTAGWVNHQGLGCLRAELARFWLKCPAVELECQYGSAAGNLHRKLATDVLTGILLPEGERRLAFEVVSRIGFACDADELARLLLVAMLYLSPLELPSDIDIMEVPSWLRLDLFRFQLSPPAFLTQRGDVGSCCRHLTRLVTRLHEAVCVGPPSARWQEMAYVFAERANFYPLYFSRGNLRPTVERRADIVDTVVRLKGHEMPFTPPPRPKGRSPIRVGVHSWSLRPHTETFATLPVFANLNPELFEVYLFVHQSNGNPIEQRARGLAKRFTVLPETLKQCVETIRAAELDILVFGNNISAGAGYAFNLANYRMARVQCIHFCNPITSGKRNIDYFLLGDLIARELNTEDCFSEKILRIEGSGICFDLPAVEAVGTVSRRDLGIPEDCTLFVSGANYHKIVPELRHTWARLLSRVPGAALLLYPFGPAWGERYPQQRLLEDLIQVFRQYGIASNRLFLAGPLKGRGDVLALNRLSDVYLDAIPYNGATSLLDPLEEGVPPVVVDGRDLRFAQGAAILRELGIPELIASDEEEYIRLAVRLGADKAAREAVRQSIRECMRRTPAFLDPRRYAQRVAEAFGRLFPETWAQVCQTGSEFNAPLTARGGAARSSMRCRMEPRHPSREQRIPLQG
jgi:glycosyltransferase involved in cell wall biosynthesis